MDTLLLYRVRHLFLLLFPAMLPFVLLCMWQVPGLVSVCSGENTSRAPGATTAATLAHAEVGACEGSSDTDLLQVDISDVTHAVVSNILPVGFDEVLLGLEANAKVVGQHLCDVGRALRVKVQLLKEELPAMVYQHNVDQFQACLTREAQVVVSERDSWMEQVMKIGGLID